MRRISILLAAICLITFTVCVSSARNSDPKMPDMAEMMKKWQAVASPGDGHKLLEKFVGEWDVTTKMWMDPSAPPMTTKGTSSVKWMLGNRFIEESFKSAMMMPDATGKMSEIPYEGRGTTGYDNFRKLYVSSWCDSMNTHLLAMSGVASPDGKTITAYGQMDEPMLDIIGRMVKYVTTINADGSHTFAIYDLAAGDNYKVLEMEYKKKG